MHLILSKEQYIVIFIGILLGQSNISLIAICVDL